MKKVLVLGGGGFIGRNLVEFLLNRGDCEVTAADIKEGSNWKRLLRDKEKSSRFQVALADFTNIESFNNLNQAFDEIYMLAAIVGVNRTLKFPHNVIRNNTLLTINTIEWVARNPVSRVLFASSSENYSSTSDLFGVKIPTDESVPLCIGDVTHPRWTYAITKMHGELAFIHSASACSYDCNVVRYQNIIGPEMGFGHAIPHIVERFVSGEKNPFKIYGHDQTRSFCYVSDAVRGTVGAMESNDTHQKIFHIGRQEEITMETLTKYIGKLIDYEGTYEVGPTYPGSVARRCPDISKANATFGYSPDIDWRTAVKLTVDWYQQFFLSGQLPDSGGFESPEHVLAIIDKNAKTS